MIHTRFSLQFMSASFGRSVGRLDAVQQLQQNTEQKISAMIWLNWIVFSCYAFFCCKKKKKKTKLIFMDVIE